MSWLLLALSASAQTITIDDQDGAPGFTTTGDDWTTWPTLGYGYDGGDSEYHYLSHTVGGSDRRGTATWSPDLPQAGIWRVEVWYRLTENRTADADHYVHDGTGGVSHSSLDQRGDGPSGWVSLGEHWCAAGRGGCSVVLDGTDDDSSDEANAVRFTLVTPDGGPPDPPGGTCESAPGTWVAEAAATLVDGAGWSATQAATGLEDGAEATSPNVDAGEYLRARSWDLCAPDGPARVDRVQVAVKARTQYDSGTYALDLKLDGGGAASTVFTGTSPSWHVLDITGDRGSWTWAELVALQASVALHGHPGGARDSDAWVDAFQLRVTYTVEAPEPEPDPTEPTTGTGDTGGGDTATPPIPDEPEVLEDTDSEREGDGDAEGDTDPPEARQMGCATGAAEVGWSALAWVGLSRRR